MEHLNRLVKVAIKGLGANKTSKAIIRVGKAVGILSTAVQSFDGEIGVTTPSGLHSEKSMQNDMTKIVVQLQLLECTLFEKTEHTHNSFSKLHSNLIRTMNEEDVKKWMLKRLSSPF